MKYPTTSTLQALAHAQHIEVFYVSADEARRYRSEAKREGGRYWRDDQQGPLYTGWHYWCCLPGCLPDSSAFGPFTSERAALRDAWDIDMIEEGDA
jgi:hypothetical protein